MAYTIAAAKSPDDLAEVARLFRAYAASLPIDLGYQDFEGELAGLPGKYAPPRGGLLLARLKSGAAIGCVALRALDTETCEMKRLYVAPEGRGLGLGRALVDAICAIGREAGYSSLRLDTLASLTAARALYAKTGFVETAAYYDTPIAGTVFYLEDALAYSAGCGRWPAAESSRSSRFSSSALGLLKRASSR